MCLNALPDAALGLRMSDDVIGVAAGFRLGYHSSSLILVPTAEHMLTPLVHILLATDSVGGANLGMHL